MAHDVFISYATPDKLTADAACAILERRGIRVWIAPRDVVPGTDWAESIIDAIESSRVMVIVFSANANKSTQIIREVERAAHHGIPLLPLRIENTLPSRSLEYFISARHWLDAMTPPLEHHLDRLAETIQRLLGDKAIPGANAPVAMASRRTASPDALPSRSRGQRMWALAAVALVTVVALVAWYKLDPDAAPVNKDAAATQSKPLTSTPEDAPRDSATVAVARPSMPPAPVESANDSEGAAKESDPADADQAVSDANETIRRNPDKPDGYLARGEAHLRLGKPELAIEDATKAIELEPSATAHLVRSQAYLRLGDAEKAIMDADESIRRDPIVADAHVARSDAYLRLGKTNEALRDATTAIRLSPTRADLYIARGSVYMRRGDAENAIADATRGIEMEPRGAYFYVARSQAFGAADRMDEAFVDANMSISLEPNNPEMYGFRAFLYRVMGKSAEEAADLSRAVELAPTDWTHRYWLAKAQAKQGDYGAAIANLEAVQGKSDAAEFDDLEELLTEYRSALADKKASTPRPAR